MEAGMLFSTRRCLFHIVFVCNQLESARKRKVRSNRKNSITHTHTHDVELYETRVFLRGRYHRIICFGDESFTEFIWVKQCKDDWNSAHAGGISSKAKVRTHTRSRTR
jgi:hypothetical protein